MAKAIKAWEGGIHGRIEIAFSVSGKLYRRFQEKGPYGYYWTKWKEYHNSQVNADTRYIEQGFSTCWPCGPYSNWKRWRLPA